MWFQVDEYYEMHNEISKLVGEFGWIDYDPYWVNYAISSIECSLPRNAHSIYYSDEVGNVDDKQCEKNVGICRICSSPLIPNHGWLENHMELGFLASIMTIYQLQQRWSQSIRVYNQPCAHFWWDRGWWLHIEDCVAWGRLWHCSLASIRNGIEREYSA